ncbi:hypothetical protein G7Y79_00041g077750 [Physcia stellaris]|nr:hypothetical protein G7Y79_00041g077750 [Physcia stellaris]
MSPTTTILFSPGCPPTSTPPLQPLRSFSPQPISVHDNNPNNYLTPSSLTPYITLNDLILNLYRYTLFIFLLLLLTLLIPILLAKLQHRRLRKLGGAPGEVDYVMSPVGNLRLVRGLGWEIGERKKERKRARDLERGKVMGGVAGTGRQGSVCEDVEMQCVEGAGKEGDVGLGLGRSVRCRILGGGGMREVFMLAWVLLTMSF